MAGNTEGLELDYNLATSLKKVSLKHQPSGDIKWSKGSLLLILNPKAFANAFALIATEPQTEMLPERVLIYAGNKKFAYHFTLPFKKIS